MSEIKYIVVAIILLMITLPVMGMIGEEPDDGKITISPTIKPVETISPVFKIAPITYSDKSTVIEKTVYTFEKLLGLQSEVTEETINEINVKHDGIVIAIIPLDSKFNGIEVHEYCLAYQYGTENWYDCEQELL